MCWAGPNVPCPSSGWGPGSWGPTGARWTSGTRWRSSTARWRRGSRFFDTADVYGDGRSERLIGSYLGEHDDLELVVATKMGRRVDQVPENYVLENFRGWVDRSRRNLEVDRLDLVQLHCPPTAVYSSRRGLRRARHPGRGAADRGVRRQRRDRRRGAHRHQPAGDRLGADHPQRVPAQAARVRAALRGGGRGRHHRPGAAGQRAAERALRRDARRSRRTTTAATTGTARRSTSGRRSPASTTRPASAPRRRSRGWSPSCRSRRRRRRPRSPGSCSSRA